MDKLDQKAEEFKARIQDGIQKKKQINLGGKIGTQNKTFKDEINDNITKVKKLRDEKKGYVD